jgi:hypothetical protein
MLKHGLSGTPEYRVWAEMKQRCTNPKNHAFARYGAKGITVCEAWLNSFSAFMDDMGARPAPDLTIERRDNAGGYEPSNCVWAKPIEQVRNRKCAIWVEMNGARITLKELADKTGVPYSTVHRWKKVELLSDADLIHRCSSARSLRAD